MGALKVSIPIHQTKSPQLSKLGNLPTNSKMDLNMPTSNSLQLFPHNDKAITSVKKRNNYGKHHDEDK